MAKLGSLRGGRGRRRAARAAAGAAALDAAERGGRPRSAGRRHPPSAPTGSRPGWPPPPSPRPSCGARPGPSSAPTPAHLLFTRTGLEQATRAVVADPAGRAAGRLRCHSVADLGCGIGADTIAFARAGLDVPRRRPGSGSPPRSPPTTSAALGLTATVSTMDATAAGPVRCGRRLLRPGPPPGRPPRLRPGRLPAAVGLRGRPADPGPPYRPQAGARHRPRDSCRPAPRASGSRSTARWSRRPSGVDRSPRCPRRATVIRGETVMELPAPASPDRPGLDVGRYLFDPTARSSGPISWPSSPTWSTGTWPTRRSPTSTRRTQPPTRVRPLLPVRGKLPIALKKLRAALRAEDVGSLTILKRGSALDVEQLRRDLRLSGTRPATVALTRIAGEPAALLLEREHIPVALCSRAWLVRQPPRRRCWRGRR